MSAPDKMVLQPCPMYGWEHPDRVKYPVPPAVEYRRADLPPTDAEVMNHHKVKALVAGVQCLRDIMDRNLIEQEGPNTITLPDGTTHTGPVVDYLHDLVRVQIRALDAALAAIQEAKP